MIIFIGSRFIRFARGPLIQKVAIERSELYPALITLRGNLKDVEEMYIDDYPVLPGKDGVFEHTFVASSGYSQITVRASDRFLHETEEIFPLFISDNPPNTELSTVYTPRPRTTP